SKEKVPSARAPVTTNNKAVTVNAIHRTAWSSNGVVGFTALSVAGIYALSGTSFAPPYCPFRAGKRGSTYGFFVAGGASPRQREHQSSVRRKRVTAMVIAISIRPASASVS